MNNGVKVIRFHFPLAKKIYNIYHRTNNAPLGHKETYGAVVGDEWSYLCGADDIDCDEDYYDDTNFDIRIRSNDDGDLCVYTRGELVGICSIGRPVARFNDPLIHEVTRICFMPYFKPISNKERKYFSKLVRESLFDFRQAHLSNDIVTYIHEYQSGKYLEYAGFIKDKHIKYSSKSKGWGSRPNRSTSDLSPKYRFINQKQKGAA
jgi:hypothetical protein|tara:strand:+ start:325 stop:942 length:618 start_codon:yes stop_codon:yes gene_type:complete